MDGKDSLKYLIMERSDIKKLPSSLTKRNILLTVSMCLINVIC